MSISQTSIFAYESIKSKLGLRQTTVYKAIKELGVATNEQVADHLGWPINRVTGRVTELNKLGVLNIEGIGKNKSGFSAKLWSVTDLNDRNLSEIAQECGA